VANDNVIKYYNQDFLQNASKLVNQAK